MNDALAVRQLAESGLGTPARVILRSLVETLLAFLLMAGQPDLLREFVAAQTFEETRAFWQKYLTQRNLSSNLALLEKKANPGLTPELISILREWREGTLQRLSGFVHPSYPSAIMNYVPDWTREDMPSSGILGSASVNRVFPLDEAAKWICYFALLLPNLFSVPRPEGLPAYTFRRDRDVDRWLMIGRDVLVELTIAHWNDCHTLAASPDSDTGLTSGST